MHEVSLKSYISTKPESSYPKDAIGNIKLLSFSRDKLATPFGSYIYRIQKYPGDIDLVEEFTECCSVSEVVMKFARSLQNMVKKITSLKHHYFSEFKAGIDSRYDIDIGTMTNGVYAPSHHLRETTIRLFNDYLLDDTETKIVMKILDKNPPHGQHEYDTITYIFRERKILRWSANEILTGRKILPGYTDISLIEALKMKGHVKIDMITVVQGKLVEVTNFLQLAYEDDNGEIRVINIDLKENHNIPVELPREIEKLYFSDMFYSPFKMIKRMFSLARHNLDTDLLNKIIPFVSSDTSLLYQIKSEIDSMILLIEKVEKYPVELINKVLDGEKIRISTVLQIPGEKILEINNLIDSAIVSDKNKVVLLKQLKKMIVRYINMKTINYLQSVGLNPPDNKYLPMKHTYNTTYSRRPDDQPRNPYDTYKESISGSRMPRSSRGSFFEDPNSSKYLSNKILQAKGGVGNKMTAWFAIFNRQWDSKHGDTNIITIDEFIELFGKKKKYDFPKFEKIVIDYLFETKETESESESLSEEPIITKSPAPKQPKPLPQIPKKPKPLPQIPKKPKPLPQIPPRPSKPLPQIPLRQPREHMIELYKYIKEILDEFLNFITENPNVAIPSNVSKSVTNLGNLLDGDVDDTQLSNVTGDVATIADFILKSPKIPKNKADEITNSKQLYEDCEKRYNRLYNDYNKKFDGLYDFFMNKMMNKSNIFPEDPYTPSLDSLSPLSTLSSTRSTVQSPRDTENLDEYIQMALTDLGEYIPKEGSGSTCGGNLYNYMIPTNYGLPTQMKPVRFQTNDNTTLMHPGTASSYASTYYPYPNMNRLKPVHIENAPYLGGCDMCGLDNFRKHSR